MNAVELILSKTEVISEKAWKKEKDFYEKLWSLLEKEKVHL